ncbi:Abscisic acid receptor PYL5, partial [Dichanthelium oligosanthes]
LLGHDAGHRGAGGRGVVAGAALRPTAGIQEVHQELPPRGRRRHHRGIGPGAGRRVRAARRQQPRAARDPGRRAAGDQLPDRRRQAPPLQLPLGDHRARGGVTGRVARQGGRVLRGGRAAGEHGRRDVHFHGHHRSDQPPISGGAHG